MDTLETLTYAVTGRIARITLNRPQHANAITFAMPRELQASVERANLDPAVHVISSPGTAKASAAATTSSDFAAERLGSCGRAARRARRWTRGSSTPTTIPPGPGIPWSTTR